MLIDLTDKVVVVTGVGRGIGSEIVRTFADEGAITVSIDVEERDLDRVGAMLDELGARGTQHLVDVRDYAGVEEVVRTAESRFGRVDVLVNNAGVGGNGLVEELDEQTWDFCHDVNLKGVFHTCKAVIPVMKRQRSGRILNAASFAAIVPMVGSAAYASSKAGVMQFTRALAGELGPWDITVNSYAPGMIPTTLNHFADRDRDERERLLDTLTLRRWGRSSDVAQLLCFLASDLAGYITGTMIDISGGKLATQIPKLPHDWASADGAR